MRKLGLRELRSVDLSFGGQHVFFLATNGHPESPDRHTVWPSSGGRRPSATLNLSAIRWQKDVGLRLKPGDRLEVLPEHKPDQWQTTPPGRTMLLAARVPVDSQPAKETP